MRKPQLFAPDNHPARLICGIELAHNLAHKNVQNVQLKQVDAVHAVRILLSKFSAC